MTLFASRYSCLNFDKHDMMIITQRQPGRSGILVLEHINATATLHNILSSSECPEIQLLFCCAHSVLFLQGLGNYEEAEEALRQCLAIHSHANGMHHLKTGQALHNLANCLTVIQRFGPPRLVSCLLL